MSNWKQTFGPPPPPEDPIGHVRVEEIPQAYVSEDGVSQCNLAIDDGALTGEERRGGTRRPAPAGGGTPGPGVKVGQG